MPASEAQILANKRNAARAKGPVTAEGKCRSRANSLKHGLTGAGIVIPESDAAEVERLSLAFQDELKPEGEVGRALTHRMAVHAVRMDRCVQQETASLSERVRQALDEFQAPEGVDVEEAEQLRAEAGHRATFDPSKEACLARKYEAAAERGFFRAMNELRQLKKKSAANPATDMTAQAQASLAKLGSFLPAEPPTPVKPSPSPSKPMPVPSKPSPSPSKPFPASVLDDWDPFVPARVDVPMTIGRAR